MDAMNAMDVQTKPSPPGGIQALAKELGISIGTISRVLNNRPNVKAETRERVLAAIQQSGFVPNPSARRLKAHPILRMAMLFAPYHGPKGEVNPYATNLVDAVARAAGEKGLQFTPIDFDRDAPLDEQLPVNAADAAVLLGHIPADVSKTLHARKVSCVNIEYDSGLPGQVGIFSGARTAVAHAVQYLAALRHERFALVTGPSGSSHFRSYAEGFDEAVREFELYAPPAWRITLTPATSNRDGAARALVPLLKERDRPTAIVFASDWLALGAYTAAADAGLRIGRDVSIIGYDNLAVGAEQDPPLTSFDVNLPELGRTIVQIAVDLTTAGSGNPPTAIHYTQHQMVKRGSCQRRVISAERR